MNCKFKYCNDVTGKNPAPFYVQINQNIFLQGSWDLKIISMAYIFIIIFMLKLVSNLLQKYDSLGVQNSYYLGTPCISFHAYFILLFLDAEKI